MKKIVILTVGFPYGNHEPFLNNELPYLENVTIVSSYIGNVKDKMSNVNNAMIWHPQNSFFKGNTIARIFAAVFAVFSPIFWKELFSSDIKPINFKKIAQLLSAVSKANQLYKYTKKELLKSASPQDEYVFYAYWMNQLAICAIRLAKKFKGKAIARCHGYDLYKRNENNHYVTFQSYLAKNLDMIFPISQAGKKILDGMIGIEQRDKIQVMRLGTIDGRFKSYDNEHVFHVVSCSNVTELKRVAMIFDAIQQITSTKIVWTHFGDGPLYAELSQKVADTKTIHQVNLKGRVSNKTVNQYYAENVIDLFINVSTSEGIPVSLMEAMAHGIPCMATDVGGTHEIVSNHVNGILLDKNIDAAQLAQTIQSYMSMQEKEILTYRSCAYSTWKEKYSSKKNATEFNDILRRL